MKIEEEEKKKRRNRSDRSVGANVEVGSGSGSVEEERSRMKSPGRMCCLSIVSPRSLRLGRFAWCVLHALATLSYCD